LLVAGFDRLGTGVVPSKCPQNPFASTASQKRTRKIAQFSLVASSFGTEVGRASEREAVVTVVIV